MSNKKIEPIVPPIESIKKKESVCIIGFAPSWDLAPFGDKNIDFWGINELYIYLNEKKISPQSFAAWFEIHDIKNSPSKQAPKHQQFLKTCGIPLITQQHWDEYPTSIAYPRDEVKKMVNESFIEDDKHSGFSDYSNQISWMIALAIYLGYKEISVYGVDMAQTSEYCLGLETKVLMQDLTYKMACNLEKGDKLIGFEENFENNIDGKKKYRRYKLTEIEDLKTVILKSYKLKMSNGDELICSKEHKWLVSSSKCENHKKQIWKTAEEINIGDIIIKPLDVWDTANTYEAGYLAAAFDGEGHLTIIKREETGTSMYRLGFTQKENKMLDYVLKTGIPFNSSIHSDGSCINLTVKNGLPEILKTLGTVRPKRLLDIFESKKEFLNEVQFKDKDKISVVAKEEIGLNSLMSIKTTEGTLIANGYASHNSFQRASCQFFIALAAGKGIKLKIPRSCELLKCGADYGFQSDNKGRFDAKKRIEGHNKALHQVRLRQAEIGYYKDKLLREQEQKFNVIDAQVEDIQKELNRIEAGNMANTSVIEFLESMPNIANEIFAKKATVIQNTNQMIQSNNVNIEALKKQIIELKTKKDKIERDVAINMSLLEDEYMANKMGTHELKGNIKANEHNLNNNLV